MAAASGRTSVASAPAPVRTPRSDAARNHVLVLDAAHEVLTEQGVDASMEEIAKRAGVGVGTIYRRFPGKDALIDELLSRAMDTLLTAAAAALIDDDGTGLETYLWVVGQAFADHRRYAELLIARGVSPTAAKQLRTRISRLTDNARANGMVAADITLGDVMTLIWGLRGVVNVSSEVAPDAWKRHLEINLAGLRTDLSELRYPAISSRQLSRLNTTR